MRLRRDGGFTLVELLVSIGILGIILPVLVNATIVGWKTVNATTTSISDSHSRTQGSELFVSDVQDSNAVDTTNPGSCNPGGLPVVVRMSWADAPPSTTTTRTATYVVTTVAGDTQLVRNYCDSIAGTTSAVVVAHGISSPAVACFAVSGLAVACGSASKVVLTMSDSTGSAFSLTGRRRMP